MINLFKIKGQKKEEAASAAGKAPVKKQSSGELRVHKGVFNYMPYNILNGLLLFPICLRPHINHKTCFSCPDLTVSNLC